MGTQCGRGGTRIVEKMSFLSLSCDNAFLDPRSRVWFDKSGAFREPFKTTIPR